MITSSSHPGLDELSEILSHHGNGDATPSRSSRARIAAHVAGCAECQESLRFVRSLAGLRDVSESELQLPADLPARVLRSRAAGERVLLPTGDIASPPQRRHWAFTAAVAVALITVVLALTSRAHDVEAGVTSGELRLTPSPPKRGDKLQIEYRPNARLARYDWLALRARLRSTAGTSYNRGIPIVTLVQLRRQPDGNFSGTVALPDSTVYAALAVEDSAGTIVDDHDGRLWEVLVSTNDGKPLFEALDQRANDLMGRNWEEGYATARRMVELYPDDMRGWSWLQAQQSWLGRDQDDSIRSIHVRRVKDFDTRLRRMQSPPSDEVGLLAWYAGSVDTTVRAHWKSRVLREAPSNTFAVQWRLIAALDTLRLTRDTVKALASLEDLWREAPLERKEQVAEVAFDISVHAAASGLPQAAAIQWADRRVSSDRDLLGAESYVAARLTTAPSLRTIGVERLRKSLRALDSLSSSERGLTETAGAQRTRHQDDRRATFAAIGRALVAAGQTTEALDTLARAAEGGWDLQTFSAVRSASLAAGDTSTARRMAAWIAVDPRTPETIRDSVHRVLPTPLVDSARLQFVHRLMERSSMRSLASKIELRDSGGRSYDLHDLTRNRVSVIAFWSPNCGPALEDLGNLQHISDVLARHGAQVISIVEESAPSPQFSAVQRDRHLTMPIYFDATHAASRAFNQWGTPYYYVLDTSGRVRFEATSSALEALARAEALRLSTEQ